MTAFFVRKFYAQGIVASKTAENSHKKQEKTQKAEIHLAQEQEPSVLLDGPSRE